ncbi:MAG: class I SAM-dependent methyltransferase [Parachlamydiaceae bacterium]
MKKIKEVQGLLQVPLLFVFLIFASSLSAETPSEVKLESFLHKYSDSIYQDLVIGNDIYPVGSDQCEPRYELIKPVLDGYNRPFSVLDLGAAQGYFSLRIAHEYPHSACVMVEANNTAYYAHHGDMLYDLCLFNSHLNNIFYLHRRMDLADLSYLNCEEHFDVVIAFLVVHLMHETLQEQIKIIQKLLKVGDNVILEVANDVGVIHTAYVEYLSQSIDCQYLGEVKRHKDPQSTSTGKLFWFKRKNPQFIDRNEFPIKNETFINLGGVYPHGA